MRLCITAKSDAHVRFGSLAEIHAPFANVSFTLKSGRRSSMSANDPKRTFGGSFGCNDIAALRDLGQGRSAVTPIASDYEAIGPRTVFICGIDQSYDGRTKSPAQN
jgi:hypothetical protein